jgi:RimJ/RimL family protein N-acetyltransferase
MFSVLERGSGRWIGRVGPWRPEGWPGNEIGWGLVRDAWGYGLAREATIAATDWALDALGWADFIHCIDPGNVRSIALATRLGSRPRGRATLPAPLGQDVDLYGQTAAEWRQGAAQRRGGLPR